jgi:hypothetical protein
MMPVLGSLVRMALGSALGILWGLPLSPHSVLPLCCFSPMNHSEGLYCVWQEMTENTRNGVTWLSSPHFTRWFL